MLLFMLSFHVITSTAIAKPFQIFTIIVSKHQQQQSENNKNYHYRNSTEYQCPHKNAGIGKSHGAQHTGASHVKKTIWLHLYCSTRAFVNMQFLCIFTGNFWDIGLSYSKSTFQPSFKFVKECNAI